MTEIDIDTIEDVAIRNMIIVIIVKSQSWWAKHFKVRAALVMCASTLYDNYHCIRLLTKMRDDDKRTIDDLQTSLAAEKARTLH